MNLYSTIKIRKSIQGYPLRIDDEKVEIVIILGLPQLTVFTYLIYWLYEDKKPVSKKIPNLKQENQRDYQVLFTGFTSIKNA